MTGPDTAMRGERRQPRALQIASPCHFTSRRVASVVLAALLCFAGPGSAVEPAYGERVKPGFVIFCLDREHAIRYSRLATELIDIMLPNALERPVTDLVPPSSHSLGYRCFGGAVDALTPISPLIRAGSPVTGRYVRFVEPDGESVFMDGDNMNRVTIRILEGTLFSATVHHDGEDHAAWVISSDAFDEVVTELPPLSERDG